MRRQGRGVVIPRSGERDERTTEATGRRVKLEIGEKEYGQAQNRSGSGDITRIGLGNKEETGERQLRKERILVEHEKRATL